ncbi:MAG TPA: pilus assembly PilX N-terminal domain-containing protein, partial [Vicinamibacterales bacterium]|nr:pilus assembly PilX N-terminal domain-containing protein [Vicinamibacterales bacterium]
MTITTPPRVLAPSHRRLSSERGIAMIVALMAMTLMIALGTSLILMTVTETKITANFRNSSEALYAADAAAERSLDDMLTIPDWNNLLNGSAKSALVDGPPSGVRTLPDGTTLDLGEIVNVANCQKVTTCTSGDLQAVTFDRPWGLNNPQWQLFSYGPLNDVMGVAGDVNSPFYIVVMVADDPSENDGDPLHDGVSSTNPGSGVIAMRAEAF